MWDTRCDLPNVCLTSQQHICLPSEESQSTVESLFIKSFFLHEICCCLYLVEKKMIEISRWVLHWRSFISAELNMPLSTRFSNTPILKNPDSVPDDWTTPPHIYLNTFYPTLNNNTWIWEKELSKERDEEGGEEASAGVESSSRLCSEFIFYKFYLEVDEKGRLPRSCEVRRDISWVTFTASRPKEMIITFISHHAHRRTLLFSSSLHPACHHHSWWKNKFSILSSWLSPRNLTLPFGFHFRNYGQFLSILFEFPWY